MASSNTSPMAQTKTKTDTAADTSPKVNTPSSTDASLIRTSFESNSSSNANTSSGARTWPEANTSSNIDTVSEASMSSLADTFVGAETDASCKANTSSTADTLLTNEADNVSNSNASFPADTPRKTKAKGNILPKNSTSFNAKASLKANTLPKLKIKTKTRGTADISLRVSTPYNANTSLKTNNPSKNQTKTKNSNARTPVDELPSPSPGPADDPNRKFTCIVCDQGGFPRENLQGHLRGRPHRQIMGLLAAYRDRDSRDSGTVQPPTDLLRIRRRWECRACGCSIQPPHDAGNLQGHLTRLASHRENMRIRWAKFGRMARNVVGLEEDEIPDDLDRSFI